jgi:hypothetical protein
MEIKGRRSRGEPKRRMREDIPTWPAPIKTMFLIVISDVQFKC